MDSQPRPTVYRSRSSTNPTRSEDAPTEPQTEGSKAAANRPSHVRSRSYVSPTEPNSGEIPAPSAPTGLDKTAEKLARIHLPGSSSRHHQHSHSHSHSHSPLHRDNDTALHKRHRPTQSDAQAPSSRTSRRQQSKEAMSNLPHLVAGLNAERERRMQAPPASRTGTHQQQHAFGPSGIISSDYNEGGRYDARLQATAAETNPAPPRPKTSFELLFERSQDIRIARRVHVKKEEIIKRDAELAAAEEEMRTRLASITAKGVEITRRLDYGYYNLLETVGNLVAIITSFQALSKQSEQLIVNFDKETRRLDAETRNRVHSFKAGFETRDKKAQALAERGQRTSAKAEDLSIRLENARLIVQNWEKREDQVKKVWDRVFGVVWWSTITVVVLVVAVVLGKEWWFRGDPVKAGLRAHSEGSWNSSLRLGGSTDGSVAMQNQRLLLSPDGDGAAGAPKVPEDVRKLLLEIAERNRNRKVMFPEIPREIVAGCREAEECVRINTIREKTPMFSWASSLPFSLPVSANRDASPVEERGDEDPRLKMLDEL